MLLVGIEAFSAGMTRALESGDKARTLVVYRRNRYCPQTSFLPERYVEEISAVEGVESVLPVKVFLNNCRTNLDMITFHGIAVEGLLEARDIHVIEGDLEAFRSEGDAALVGRDFARRRALDVGDKFRFGDIIVKVAGIFQSSDSTQEGVILTHLEFLQRSGPVNRLGTVTQFEVRIDDPAHAEAIASEIDARLATAEEPTHTRLLAAFLKRATSDLREILRFARIFGVACVAVVVVLVANTIFMSVHERCRELGILRAIGFRAPQLASMVLAEAAAIALTGGVLGLVAMFAVIRWTGIAIGVEGVQVSLALTPGVAVMGLVFTLVAALLAALIPATRAARTDVVKAIRGGA
jgi:putative ABC transport system permease protein